MGRRSEYNQGRKMETKPRETITTWFEEALQRFPSDCFLCQMTDIYWKTTRRRRKWICWWFNRASREGCVSGRASSRDRGGEYRIDCLVTLLTPDRFGINPTNLHCSKRFLPLDCVPFDMPKSFHTLSSRCSLDILSDLPNLLRYVIANDLSPTAVATMNRNIMINHLGDTTEGGDDPSQPLITIPGKVRINEGDAWYDFLQGIKHLHPSHAPT
jgi:hypothetical protein